MNIGIDVGGSHIAVGLVNDKNEIIFKEEHNWTEEEKIDLLNSVEEYSKQYIREILEENDNITKIGLGFPSANIIDGIVTKCGKTINLPKILSEEFNIPTFLKNDVKCSALCEKSIGSLKEYDNCLFMTLGTGIGGAYFYKNEMVTPNKYQGFEIGHMIIDKNGPECKCGNKGCFEQCASMRIFRDKIEKLFNIERVTSHKLFEIMEKEEREEEVNNIIEEYIEYLSIGLINLINIFEPDAISIGGSFAYYAPIFMNRLKEKLKQNFKNREIPDILIAKYENDAGIIGASMLENN